MLTNSYNGFPKWLQSALYRYYVTSGWKTNKMSRKLALDISKLEQLWSEDEKSREAIESLVTLFDVQMNEKIILRLVPPEKTDPEKGRISYFSLLGSELLRLQTGDKVEINIFGRKEYFYILEIKPCFPD